VVRRDTLHQPINTGQAGLPQVSHPIPTCARVQLPAAHTNSSLTY
jgi:hypothetical protein